MRVLASAIVFVGLLAACGDDAATPTTAVTTERCVYEPVPATGHAGGTVAAAALQAGAAEKILDVPVSTALGGYTARAGFIGKAGVVDARRVKISGTFNPSIGVTTAPRVKALVLTAGEETVVILKMDAIFVYEGMVYDIEQRLGPEYAGKVILTASHSHSAWAQFTGHGPLKLGAGQLRQLVYDRFLDTFETAAREALAARRAAKIGIFSDASFDPTDQINRDRRGDNDMLPGGHVKDNHFFMIRVDGTDNVPIAAMPIFGEHGTLNDDDNPLASTDSTGALERVFQERFGSKVVVMHVQSAGGDNSPVGHGGVDCNTKPGRSSDPCFTWANEEGHGRAAADTMYAAWQSAGANMKDSIELEMLTRSVETGPFPDTFKIRDGALGYAAFDINRMPDGIIMDGASLAGPVDEFNAPVGAALCEKEDAMFPAAAIPGTEGLLPYGSCLRLDVAGEILGELFNIDFQVDETHPVCESTRTTVSTLRIGEYLIGTMPGELTVMLADYIRRMSPAGADKTIIFGYSQGHVGYLLEPEDWVLGGYEPSVTFWGPLEGEYLANRLLSLMPLALTPEREDGAAGGATKVATARMTDDFEIDNPAMMAGTVPATVPTSVWSRVGMLASAQPAASIPRVSGIATFVWIGDDPSVKTPRVTLEYEVSTNVYQPIARGSGRLVEDSEIVLAYTPDPLQRSGPQTHYWTAEWQAVPWVGAGNVDALADRGGLPLGKYRFHVEGSGWTLNSSSFDVTKGGLAPVAIRTGGKIRTTVRWHAPKGFRLMDMTAQSNQAVPVRSQMVTVEVRLGTNVLDTVNANTDANGVIEANDNVTADNVRVIDRFLNETVVNL